MADENKQGQTPDNEGQQNQPVEQGNGKTPISQLPPDIQTYIEELRQENAKWRKESKKALDDARKADEDRLTQQQEWQKLAEQRAARLAELESVAAKAETIEAAFNAGIDARLKQIPDEVRKRTVDPIRKALSPLEFNQWLDANIDLLSVRKAPDLDAGAGNRNGKRTTALTAEQLEMAKALKLTPEQYAKRLEEAQSMKGQPNSDEE